VVAGRVHPDHRVRAPVAEPDRGVRGDDIPGLHTDRDGGHDAITGGIDADKRLRIALARPDCTPGNGDRLGQVAVANPEVTVWGLVNVARFAAFQRAGIADDNLANNPVGSQVDLPDGALARAGDPGVPIAHCDAGRVDTGLDGH